MPSMAPTNQLSTHKVMAKGNQTKSPAKMYLRRFMFSFSDKRRKAHNRQRWLKVLLCLWMRPRLRQAPQRCQWMQLWCWNHP